MESSKQAAVRGGLGLPMILFLIFLVLRLTDNIDWPWYAVASPLLIAYGFGILVFVFVSFVVLFAADRDGR